MRKTGVSMSYGSIWYNTGLIHKKNMEGLASIARFSSSDTAKFRQGVIEFHKKYGTQATKDAFGVSKATIYRWRGKYLKEKKESTSLIPISRKPKRVREMQTDYRIVSFIKTLREEHPRIGKEKIYPLLSDYCENKGIKPIKPSTIGKVIKRHNMFFQKRGRIYHDPSKGHAKRHVVYHNRARRSPKVYSPGFIEIDSITRFYEHRKVYIINAVDVYTRFSFSYAYLKLNSRNSLDFLKHLEEIYPFHTIQTDNGLEFHGEFEKHLKERQVEHIFTYPRSPKINGYIERCNRSLSEEFIEHNLMYSDDIQEFNRSLLEHVIWYNTKRVHKSLKNQTPMDFILQHNLQSHMYVTHT